MKNRIELVQADVKDAKLLHRLQVEAFTPLYEKYHDDATSPAKEPLERIIQKVTEANSEFYIICMEGETVGGIRIRHYQGETVFDDVSWISPVFVIPNFQNMGIAQKAIQKVFDLYPKTTVWKLSTIEQETANCHLYEKLGFVRVGNGHAVNEQMTLIDYERVCYNRRKPGSLESTGEKL
ncbi:MAG: GNAT family N-acetyltransferase [Lachnospiraceae bacterium]|nr:GNAT family N-acetyltransferase [Lachnospiraceae bacterium]